MANYLLTHTGAQVDEAVSLALAGVQDGSITAAKIQDGSITAAKLNSSVFATSADVVSGTSSTTLITPAALSESGLITSGAVNLIRNPKFTINQRNVSGTVTLSAGAFGHDGWKAGASGCTYTFTTSQGRTTLTITAGSLIQTIEGRDLPAGVNTMCLSWGGTCQGKIGAGSYGASGLTGEATGGTDISVKFGTGTLYEPQLERGTVAGEFDCLPDWLEELRCLRYLPRINGVIIGSDLAVSSTTAYICIPLKVPTRVPCTGIEVSAGSSWKLLNATGGALTMPSPPTIASSDVDTLQVQAVVSGGLVAGNITRLYTDATGYILGTGAEI